MGYLVERPTGVGFVQVAAAPAMIASGPAGWIALGISSVASLIPMLFKIGYNHRKLNDTRLTEQAQIGYNALWFALSGENLGGFGQGGCDCSTSPGSCGSMGCAIFNQSHSQYPNVPSGPAGNPGVDVNAVMSQANQIYQQGKSQLQRPESVADYDANFNGSMAMFQQVLNARQTSDTTGDVSLSTITSNPTLQQYWPFVAAGALILLLR